MKIRAGDIKRLLNSDTYTTSFGYDLIYYKISGIVGVRSKNGEYFEFEDKAKNAAEAKRFFINWFNKKDHN